MMAAGQWEVVGGKSKKPKNKKNGEFGNKISKGQKKKVADAMPKADDSGPIKESPTMFDVFLEKERKRAEANRKLNESADTGKGKDSQQPKKKNPEKKKNASPSKPSTLETAINELNMDQIKAHLAISEATYPDTPIIWLKDLAMYFNLKLTVDVRDPVFSSQPVGYPSTLLSSDLKELIFNTLSHCTTHSLQLFFEICLHSIDQDMSKGQPTLGYLIFLQCLAQEMPAIAMQNSKKCESVRNSFQNRPNVYLSMLWAIGQAGNKDLSVGLRVWLKLMFPILGMKAYSKYAIEYLEKLLSLHANTTSVTDVLGVRELFPVLDFVHSPSGMSANQQKQLLALYPRLKELSYGSYGAARPAVLRNYFPSYLRRLEPDCSPLLKKELLGCLIECLKEDQHTYSIWRQLYIKHLAQSSILIAHLLEEFDNLPANFPKSLLKETLSTFHVTNEDLISQGRDMYYLKDCVDCCNEALEKMSSQKFPLGKVILLISMIVGALLAYDIQINGGSFKNSTTGQLMKETGTLAIAEQAWGRIIVYSEKSFKWLETNVPVYFAWLEKTIGPYFVAFWEKLFALSVQLWQSTQCVRDWCHTNLPVLLKVMNDHVPYYLEKMLMSLQLILTFLVKQASVISEFASYYFIQFTSWLFENVLTGSLAPGNIQKVAGDTVAVMQKYVLEAYNWILGQVSTSTTPQK